MKRAIWLCVALLIGGLTGWKARDGEVSSLERQVNDWSGLAVDGEYLVANKFVVESGIVKYQTVWLDQTTGKFFWCPSADDCKWRDRSEAEHLTPTTPITCQGPDSPSGFTRRAVPRSR
jgi:hypothetical protein